MLTVALSRGYGTVAKLLLKFGAKINYQGKD